MTDEQVNQEVSDKKRFFMHYNIQSLVISKDRRNMWYRSRKDLRSKTFVLEMEELPVQFAISSLLDSRRTEGVKVLANLGVTTVIPFTVDKITGRKKYEAYSRSEGRRRSLENMKQVELNLSGVTIDGNDARFLLEYPEEKLVIVYHKNTKTGSVKVYLSMVDGNDASSLLEYA